MQNGFEESGDVQDIRLVVDTIPTLAWSARPDGSAEFFNQRWLDYTGLSAEQALGSGWQVAIHPDELPRILETFREALNSVKPYEVEGRFRLSFAKNPNHSEFRPRNNVTSLSACLSFQTHFEFWLRTGTNFLPK